MNLLTALSTRQPIILAGGKVKVIPVPSTGSGGGYHLHTPFHQDFVDDLKSQLPAHARRFEKVTKVWWVSEPYLTAAVLDILATWFNAGLGQELARLRAEMPPAIEEIGTI